MSALALAIVGPFVMLGIALLGLGWNNRSGQPALRSYRSAHGRGRWLT